MNKITRIVHINFNNGDLTLYPLFFYACSMTDLKKVVKFVDEAIYNEDKCLSILQEILYILYSYYYFDESLKPTKQKQIKNKMEFIHEKTLIYKEVRP